MIIAGHELEYIDDGHIYLVDGVIVPSITQILKQRFGGMYDGISPDVLNRAAARGTEIHRVIEDYVVRGEDDPAEELRGFKWLERQYGFRVERAEAPVILFRDGAPAAAGRCDLVLEHEGKLGGADVKTTSALQKEYVAYQLNLYRMAYMASYGKSWDFLWAIHLRGEKRKITPLPINEAAANKLLEDYYEQRDTDR